MFRIAICDDEKYFRKELKKAVDVYMKAACLEYEIDLFESGEDILALGIGVIKYNTIFLDINMKKIDGIETAKEIRKINPNTFIVFITAYINYTLEGYKVDAIRYILKDDVNLKESLQECLIAIRDKMNYHIVKKEFSFREGERKVLLDHILYIESRLHMLEFNVMENDIKKYTLYSKLDDIETEINSNNFIRVHQSFLVNLKYVKEVLANKLIFTNNIELPIAKTRYKSVKDNFIAYLGEI